MPMPAPASHRDVAGLAPLVVLASVVVFVLFAGFVVLLWNRVPRPETADEVRARERLARLNEVRDRDAKVIGAEAPYWIDKGKGIVGLPLDRAMERVIAEHQGRQPAPTSVAVAPVPPPATPAAPAPAPEPAAP